MLIKSLSTSALSLLAAIGMATAAPLSGGNADAGKTKANVCAACHGADGNSPNGQFPTLAGQHAGYIYDQLKLFKSGERSDPIMSSMAAGLSDQDMKDLAAYFSVQEIKPGPPSHGKLAELGEAIYRNGDADAGVAACTACHGPTGLGNAAAGFPRIAGQHAAYIEEELKAFRDGTRAGSAQAAIMQGVASGLSDDAIKALAAYVSGLTPNASQ